MKLSMIPYNRDGQVDVSHLEFLYRETCRHNLLRSVFPAGEVLTSDDFVSYFKRQGNHMHIIANTEAVVGYAWLSGVQHNHAWVHYCTFPIVWGRQTPVVADACLKYWFGLENGLGIPLFDVLLGRTPVDNVPAVRFLDRIGMTIVGIVPGVGLNIYDGTKPDVIISFRKRSKE